MISIYWLQRSALNWKKKNYEVPTRKSRWELEKLNAQLHKVQDAIDGIRGANECESGNVL